MGIFDKEYREKLRADTPPELVGRAERCLSAGDLPYGYIMVTTWRREHLPKSP
jgi:hypothetical protein